MADISKIKTLDGTTYDLKDAIARYHLPYGVCDTSVATTAKALTIDGITELAAGLAIVVKFTYSNSAPSPTLNLNNLGAKSIRQYGTTSASTSSNTSGWMADAVVLLVYDGTAWYFNKGYNTNSTYTITSVYCGTAAAEAAKVTSNASYYVLRTGNTFEITMRYANSYQGAITLNVNSTGAKPIWINDAPTSASNYTLPAGKYLVYYNGAQYRFRTDDKQPISISGTVNGYGLHKTVPSTAVFTDTTYTADTSNLVTTTVPNVTSVGSAPTLGTAIPADDITAWDAGSTPTLGTAIPADDITSWTTNTPTAFSVSGEKLSITSGTAASLSYTAKSIPNVTSVGSVPSLSYTAKSIPNVTSVGSAPTLGTAITVATGSLASDGSGGTVATGITAS